uniref:Uncharacterized protein n=1 Tax=Heterorhabditis bacteriophora TaxID=37862 RepID=A0A1I7XF67_HETBA
MFLSCKDYISSILMTTTIWARIYEGTSQV